MTDTNICRVDGCNEPRALVQYAGHKTKKLLKTCLEHKIVKYSRALDVGTRTLLKDGYVLVKIPHKWVFEHRQVMEAYLGRKLSPGENVHHINGDKSDNSIENLELWSTSQPAGQRIEDKLKWAQQILDFYSKNKYK